MTATTYNPAHVAAVLVKLTAALDTAGRFGLKAEDLVAMLQAGRLSANYGEWKATAEGKTTDLDFTAYATLNDVNHALNAGEYIHRQLAKRRAILVAMGELEAEDA